MSDPMQPPVRVLYIDDSQHDRELVRDSLLNEERGNYLLTETSTRREFERELANNSFDLVLSDFNILGYDGLQVLDQVKKVNPSLPVIIVTGTGSEEVAVEAMKRGARDYVIKSTSHIQHLPQTIRVVLDNASLEEKRHTAEEALRQAHEQITAIVRQSPLAVITLDLQGRVLTWNPAAERIVGWGEAEALGKPFTLVTQGKTGQFHAFLNASLQGRDGMTLVIHRMRPDGMWMDAELHTSPLHGPSGELSGVLILLEDITERKQAELALKVSESKFRSVVERAFEGIVLTDHEGNIIEWNDAQARITGISRGEALGRPIWDIQISLASEEFRTEAHKLFLKDKIITALTQGESPWLNRSAVQKIFRPDGTERILESSVYSAKLDRETIFCSIVRDITDRVEMENALETSEDKFRCLVEQSGEGIVLTDEQGNILEWNHSEEQITGLSKSEVVGKPIWEMIFQMMPLERQEVRTYEILKGKWTDMLVSGQSQLFGRTIEIKMRRKDGTERIVEMLSYTVRTLHGNAIGGTFRDITERKQSEEKLRLLSRAIEQSPASVVITDTSGAIEYVNPKFSELTGFSFEEALGQNPRILKSGLTLPETYRDLWAQILLGKAWRGELCNRKKNGDLCWETASISPVTNDIGTITHFIAVKEDITERKQAEAALRESEETFRTSFEYATTGVCLVDLHGNFIKANQRLGTILGYQAEELCKLTINDVTYPEDHDVGTQHLLSMISGELDNASFEKRYLRKSGEIIWCLISAGIVRNPSGQPLFFVGHLQDVTEEKQAKQALAESEARFRRVFEDAPLGIFQSTLDGRLLAANAAFAHMFRYASPQEAITHIYNIAEQHYAKPEQRGEIVRKLNEDPTAQTFECEFRRTDGTLFLADLLIHPVIDPRNPMFFEGILEDITERKRFEEALRQSEQRLALHVQMSPLAFIEFDAHHTIQRWNPAAEKIFGYAPDEVIGKHTTVLVPEHARTKILQTLRSLEGQTGGERSTNENITKTGRIITCDWYNTPLVTQDGKLIGIASMVEDISEQVKDKVELIRYRDHLEDLIKERNAELVESEASLRKFALEITDLYDNAPCGYHSLGPDGTITRINGTELNWLGYTRDEIVGKKKLNELLPSRFADRFVREFHAFMKEGSVQDVEVEMIRKDGSVLPVMINATALYDSGGNFIMSRETLTDNTERVKAENALREAKEAAESANRAKSVFLANMSHEIRTPMNAILGFAQLMLRDPSFTPSQKQHLEIVNRSGEHLLELINDILEMSKIEAGRTTLVPTTFDLVGMIRDVEVMFRIRTEAKGLIFKVIPGEDLPRYVITDENKLRQIFINLLGNAVKFTERGGITWQISCAEPSGNALRLVSTVEDTGPGIGLAEMDKLFQVFGQASAGQMKGGGTGLGLAISSKFAQMMGGELSVTSQLGVGSIFRIEIDVLPGDSKDVLPSRPEKQVTRLSSGQPAYQVLIVDDQAENRQLAAELLKSVGFDVNEAANGLEAIQAFQAKCPDLILMDIHMPVMDGYEAMGKIKSTEEGRSLPIIALTANAFKEDELKARQAGADDYLRKPLKDFELFRAIESCLNVAYDYTVDTPDDQPAQSGGGDARLDLPPEAIESIRQATLTANLGTLLDLIDRGSESAPMLAKQLRELASEYQYDRILELLS